MLQMTSLLRENFLVEYEDATNGFKKKVKSISKLPQQLLMTTVLCNCFYCVVVIYDAGVQCTRSCQYT